jgi:hypothetical protein
VAQETQEERGKPVLVPGSGGEHLCAFDLGKCKACSLAFLWKDNASCGVRERKGEKKRVEESRGSR